LAVYIIVSVMHGHTNIKFENISPYLSSKERDTYFLHLPLKGQDVSYRQLFFMPHFTLRRKDTSFQL